MDAAKREFQEELGVYCTGEFIPLTAIRQKSGKIVYAWALEGDIIPGQIKSNTFVMEWPPKSGKREEFLEIDKGEWFNISEARQKINESQVAFIEELISKLDFNAEQLKRCTT